MLDKKTFTWIFFGFLIFLTYYLYNNNDQIAQIIANNGIQGIFWYFISNPSYIMILISIYLLNREAGFVRDLIGGFMLIIALDIISFPRFSPIGISKDTMLLASADGIIVNKLLSFGLSYSNVYFIYYLILPIALIIGSITILGITDFFKKMFYRGG